MSGRGRMALTGSRRVPPLLAAALASALLAPALAAQGTTLPADSLDLREHDFRAVAVSAHPWSTAVALTVVLPEGSASDPMGLPGTAWLLGEIIRDALQQRVGPANAVASVLVERSQTTFQVLAVPGDWRGAYQALLEAVFSPVIDAAALERSRTEALARFRFESGAPIRDFQAEVHGLLSGAGTPWSREPRGSVESVTRITAADLSEFARRAYRRDEAVLTLVGALDAEPGLQVYPSANEAQASTPGGAAGPAWSDGSRLRLVRRVTNAWVAVAYPAPSGASRTTLDFLVAQLSNNLNPLPRDPGLFGAEVRLVDLPDGSVILVEAAVLPEDQLRWEERILAGLAVLTEWYADPALLNLHRRRFRNLALSGEGAPEIEGLRMARDLHREGRVRDLPLEIGSLDAGEVLESIASLREPRILVFGPDLGGGQP